MKHSKARLHLYIAASRIGQDPTQYQVGVNYQILLKEHIAQRKISATLPGKMSKERKENHKIRKRKTGSLFLFFILAKQFIYYII